MIVVAVVGDCSGGEETPSLLMLYSMLLVEEEKVTKSPWVLMRVENRLVEV